MRPASRWIDELVGDQRDDVEVASFIAGVAEAEHSVSAHDDRTRLLLAHVRAGGRLDRASLVAADRSLRRSLASVRARERAAVTAYDGDLAGVAVPSPFASDRAIGITRLETWLACPHAYFMEYVLRVSPVDDPEVLLQISAMERGSLVHRVLDRFLRRVLDGELEVPAADTPWSPRHHALAQAVLEEEMAAVEAAGLAGRSLLWEPERRRLRDDITAVLTFDDRRRAGAGLVPLSSEQPFEAPPPSGADGGCWPPLHVDLSGGRSITFRGQVDRVDVAGDGRVAIIDYKSGKSTRYAKLSDQRPLGEEGRQLQLPVYAAAAAAALGRSRDLVRADYVFTREPAAPIGYQMSEEIWREFLATLEVIADTFDAGLYPPRPARPQWMHRVPCEYCDPDGLGTGARYRQWLRKRLDPRLLAYAQLIGELPVDEPGEDDGHG